MTQGQKWLLVSAARGKQDAIKAVEASREVLPQDMMQQAQERVSVWLKQHGKVS